jgi:hypothetical protein
MNVIGRQTKLDDTRSVFVGKSADNDGLTYIKLVNEEGVETKLKITAEARRALVSLLASEDITLGRVAGEWVHIAGIAAENLKP